MFIDNDFPKLLGAELYRPHPAYIVEMAAEPVVVHDFTKCLVLWQEIVIEKFRELLESPGALVTIKVGNQQPSQSGMIGRFND